MKTVRVHPWLLAAFFLIFMIFPLGYVLLRAFLVNGTISLTYFQVMLGSEYFREVILNSLNLALCVTLLTSCIAYPIALLMTRYALPRPALLHAGLLLPLVVPPFVGVLGIRQLLGRFGTLNLLLLDAGVIDQPIEWLGGGNLFGIVVLQVLHLVPIMYLSLAASLRNVHVTLEEAATIAGAHPWQILRRITIPLSLPGWFAGAVLVFVSSFTDLGTPLVFEYRNVIPVQVYNMLSDLNENPVGYSFVVLTCILCLITFYAAQSVTLQGSFAGTGRSKQDAVTHSLSSTTTKVLAAALSSYIAISLAPHLGVLLLSVSDRWFMSALPEKWTLLHFVEVLRHPMTARSLFNSLWLSLLATFLTAISGYACAHILVRSRMRGKWFYEICSLLPLAVPGIVFAFGYLGAFSGTILDSRLNPFPLLVAAYIVRRMPSMTRSASAGLQEATVVMEEAALMVGAPPSVISRRIVFPLIRRHVIAGSILTFAYSMLEVSDGLLLAMEEKFYPVSKAMYSLIGRPDGIELASALGVIVMFLMVIAFASSEAVMANQKVRSITIILVIFGSGLFANVCTAQSDKTAEKTADELILVSAHWEGIRREFARGFSAHWRARSGRSVEFRWLDVGGTSDIVRYIRTQFKSKPDGIDVDLMFGGGTDSFLELEKDGLLQVATIQPEVLKNIPHDIAGVELVGPQHTWFAAALSTFGILYNKAAVTKLKLPVPATWRDLADPVYKGALGSSDPRKSGSMHSMYEIILQGYGWNDGWGIIQGIAANVKNFSGTASQVGKEISIGEITYGLSIDTYAGEVIRRFGSDRLGFVIPTDYPAVNGDGIAVIKGAPNSAVADAFISFVLSEEGQRLWYSKRGSPGGPVDFDIGKLPILPAMYATTETSSVVKGSPFEWKGALRYDAVLGAKRWNIINDLFGAFVIDVHDRLKYLTRGTAKAEERLTTFPISQSVIASLLSDPAWLKTPELRSATLRDWGVVARNSLPIQGSLWQSLQWLPTPLFGVFLLVSIIRRRKKNW